MHGNADTPRKQKRARVEKDDLHNDGVILEQVVDPSSHTSYWSTALEKAAAQRRRVVLDTLELPEYFKFNYTQESMCFDFSSMVDQLVCSGAARWVDIDSNSVTGWSAIWWMLVAPFRTKPRTRSFAMYSRIRCVSDALFAGIYGRDLVSFKSLKDEAALIICSQDIQRFLFEVDLVLSELQSRVLITLVSSEYYKVSSGFGEPVGKVTDRDHALAGLYSAQLALESRIQVLCSDRASVMRVALQMKQNGMKSQKEFQLKRVRALDHQLNLKQQEMLNVEQLICAITAVETNKLLGNSFCVANRVLGNFNEGTVAVYQTIDTTKSALDSLEELDATLSSEFTNHDTPEKEFLDALSELKLSPQSSPPRTKKVRSSSVPNSCMKYPALSIPMSSRTPPARKIAPTLSARSTVVEEDKSSLYWDITHLIQKTKDPTNPSTSRKRKSVANSFAVL